MDIKEFSDKFGNENLMDSLLYRGRIDKGRKDRNPNLPFKEDICPLSYIYKYFPIGIQFWNLYHTSKDFHTLPVAGGICDQPNILIEAFNIISNQIEKHKIKVENGSR